jgi:hypothetical protein
VSHLGAGRATTRVALVAAVVVVLAGCGTPPQLDQEEQVAFARECTSLIERNLSDNSPPRTALLGSDKLDLDAPASFYSLLEKLRGPSTFDLHDPKRQADTARQPLDNCSTRPAVLSSLFGSTTTSTSTTTTSTTVPGS